MIKILHHFLSANLAQSLYKKRAEDLLLTTWHRFLYISMSHYKLGRFCWTVSLLEAHTLEPQASTLVFLNRLGCVKGPVLCLLLYQLFQSALYTLFEQNNETCMYCVVIW